GDGDGDQADVVKVPDREHDDHREQCAEGADQVATTRRTRSGKPLERDDEAHRGKQVGEIAAVAVHGRGSTGVLPVSSSARAGGGRRPRPNISSMRSVTTKPPTRLSVASNTATRPSTMSSV